MKRIQIPKSYDAGQTVAGKSLGFRAKLSLEMVRLIFKTRPDIFHIETPEGYFLRRNQI